MALEWSHMVFYVEDMERMLDFYTRVLGFEISDRGPLRDREIVFLSQSPREHHQIAFIGGRTGGGPSNSVNHAAFRIGDLTALRGLAGTLDAEAVTYSPRTHGNTWLLYFQEPESNGLELFCDTPWKVAQPQAVPWDTGLDDQALREWTEARFRNEPGFGPAAE